MCGIVAYKGQENTSKMLLQCIKSLEYRGYDSVGMAVKQNEEINMKKNIGKIDEVDKKENFSSLKGSIGIAHTRWATTGNVTKTNSHPHISNDKGVYIVHNGIIENYQELKKELKEKGIECQTETDSEVIPQFISYFLSQKLPLNDAVRKTLLKLQGSFAIAGLTKEDNKLIIARRDSPLVLGVKENKEGKEFFAASDVPAFLSETNKVIYLDDNEYGFIDNDEIKIFDLETNSQKEKKVINIEWDVEQAKKGEYPHFMLKEIYEQKHTIEKAIQQDSGLIKNVVKELKDAFGIFFVACGTSYHAAVSASYIFTHVAKKHVNVVLASEFSNYESFITDKTVIVPISQSGETADLLDAVKTAKKKGSKIISIVNVMGSTLTRLSNLNIMMNSGPEICVLSTKSYTSQLAILILLAYTLAGKEEEGKKLIKEASNEVINIIDNNQGKIEKIAEKIKNQHSLFLIGRDLAYPSSLEGALKIKEVSYIHAEGFAGGELKHGTIALIEKDVPCIVFTTEATKHMILSNASEIKVRGGYIIGIDAENNQIYDDFIHIKELGNANPITMIVPVQILAYYLALKRDCDPDKPRNLAKSVTVR